LDAKPPIKETVKEGFPVKGSCTRKGGEDEKAIKAGRRHMYLNCAWQGLGGRENNKLREGIGTVVDKESNGKNVATMGQKKRWANWNERKRGRWSTRKNRWTKELKKTESGAAKFSQYLNKGKCGECRTGRKPKRRSWGAGEPNAVLTL